MTVRTTKLVHNNSKKRLKSSFSLKYPEEKKIKRILPLSGDRFHHMFYDGQKRTYKLHIPPSYDDINHMPLVVVLHGYMGSSMLVERKTNMSNKGDEEGFIVAYPNGAQKLRFLRGWNAGFSHGLAVLTKMDDTGFIRALIKKLQSTLKIDSNRIYVTGHSNGGTMSYRIGAELSDIVAAIGVNAGSIGGRFFLWGKNRPVWVIPKPTNPVSVIVFQGMKDKYIPYDGGKSSCLFTDYCLSVDESVSFWVKHNKCDYGPQITVSKSKNVVIKRYANGSNGSEVILYTSIIGGHEWPGGPRDPVQDISATDLIWKFFKEHPKQ